MANATAVPTNATTTAAPVSPPVPQPTRSPTMRPTLAPVVQGPERPNPDLPCEPDENGLYGIETTDLELVQFAYALETVPGTTDAEVRQIVADLEAEIAASVVRRLAPDCAGDTRRRLQQGKRLVGLSPKPDDQVLTDRDCPQNTAPNRCDLVGAELTIYLEDLRRNLQGESIDEFVRDAIEFKMGDKVNVVSINPVTPRKLQSDDFVVDVADAIQTSMVDGEFNDLEGRSTDADNIVSVTWVDDLPGARTIEDDDGLDLLWIIVIAVGGAAVLFLICAAYLCTRRKPVDNENEQRNKDDESEGSDGGRASL